MARPASIEALEPAAVWKFFRGLASVPRPSKREGKIRAHVLELAEELSLDATEDTTGNIVCKVPATKGCESAPTIVVQGHLDMVCEKNEGTEHDFDEDPIRLILDQDDAGESIVRADGTTLGADNGIGVAMALAAATSPEVVHGPLELLFTIDEETGMTGAKALRPESFEGNFLINLDTEEDDSLCIGCAGGKDTDLSWHFDTVAAPSDALRARVSVSGLRGGHSGCDIHENRGNAIKLLGRVLRGAGLEDLQIASISGGSMRNAIPREAHAIVACTPAGMRQLQQRAESIVEAGRGESVEPELTIRVESQEGENAGEGARPKDLLTAEDTRRLLRALAAIPSGVVAMHPEIPGLVQTSNNLSTIRSSDERGRRRVSVGCLTRSSLGVSVDCVADGLVAIGELSGAKATHANGYPGWQPNAKSMLLSTASEIYEKLFGAKAKVEAIHAGLECGIIQDAVGRELDMVSFGPRIEGAHSPDERVWIDSVHKSWNFLVEVLAVLSRR